MSRDQGCNRRRVFEVRGVAGLGHDLDSGGRNQRGQPVGMLDVGRILRPCDHERRRAPHHDSFVAVAVAVGA